MGPEFSKEWVEGTHEERGRNKVGTLQGFDSTDKMENQTVICSMIQLIVPCDYMIIHRCVRASGCRTELTAEARTAFYVLLLQKPESDALHLSSMIEEWPFLGFLFDWPISKPPAGCFWVCSPFPLVPQHCIYSARPVQITELLTSIEEKSYKVQAWGLKSFSVKRRCQSRPVTALAKI